MLVKDAMTRKTITISPQATIAEAIDVMIHNRISGLAVVDASSTLVGIISESDFLRRVEIGTLKKIGWLEALLSPGHLAETYAHTRGRHVEEAMTSDVVTVAETDDLQKAVTLMQDRGIKRLPVIADKKMVGIITRADILRALRSFVSAPYEEQATSDSHIGEQIVAEMQKQSWAPVAAVQAVVKQGVVTFEGVISDERQRKALRALAETIDGVREVHDAMVWIEPYSGMTLESAESEAKHQAGQS